MVWYGKKLLGKGGRGGIASFCFGTMTLLMPGVDISISMSKSYLVCGFTETTNSHVSNAYCPPKPLGLPPARPKGTLSTPSVRVRVLAGGSREAAWTTKGAVRGRVGNV
jgi:hypothetical protein